MRGFEVTCVTLSLVADGPELLFFNITKITDTKKSTDSSTALCFPTQLWTLLNNETDSSLSNGNASDFVDLVDLKNRP